MPATAQIPAPSFGTAFHRPVHFLQGGGEGFWGLCAMEIASILSGDAQSYGRPHDWPESIHESLSEAIRYLNDARTSFGQQLPDDKADRLWSLLPALLGTAAFNTLLPEEMNYRKNYEKDVRFPVEKFFKAMGYGAASSDYSYPTSAFIGLSWDEIFEGVKVVITLFWDEVMKGWETSDKSTPIPVRQDDFTQEQYDRLVKYVELVKSDANTYRVNSMIRDVA